MPPSGFHEKHSTNLVRFFRSCLEDLVLENQGVRPPRLAIQREINHIDKDLNTVSRSSVPSELLKLTRAFYAELISRTPENYEELVDYSELVYSKIKAEIEAIKVAD